jgi:hypothetical protein
MLASSSALRKCGILKKHSALWIQFIARRLYHESFQVRGRNVLKDINLYTMLNCHIECKHALLSTQMPDAARDIFEQCRLLGCGAV